MSKPIKMIPFDVLLNLTVGDLVKLTNKFLEENPEFKTAEQLLEEREK